MNIKIDDIQQWKPLIFFWWLMRYTHSHTWMMGFILTLFCFFLWHPCSQKLIWRMLFGVPNFVRVYLFPDHVCHFRTLWLPFWISQALQRRSQHCKAFTFKIVNSLLRWASYCIKLQDGKTLSPCLVYLGKLFLP